MTILPCLKLSVFAMFGGTQISLVHHVDKIMVGFLLIKLHVSYTLRCRMQQAEYLFSFFYFGSVYMIIL